MFKEIQDTATGGKCVYYDVPPGSPEWYILRCGRPTASEFSKLITPKTAKLSSQANKYANVLVAELIVQRPINVVGSTFWIDRGKELEAAAVSEYELVMDVESTPGGFFTDEKGKFGASPDRLVGLEGLAEFKCPAPQTHIEYALEQKIDEDHYPQLMGQLLVTGRKWVDIFSYHPEIKPVRIRVERDEEYIAKLENALDIFRDTLDAKIRKLVETGYLTLEIPEETKDLTMAG